AEFVVQDSRAGARAGNGDGDRLGAGILVIAAAHVALAAGGAGAQPTHDDHVAVLLLEGMHDGVRAHGAEDLDLSVDGAHGLAVELVEEGDRLRGGLWRMVVPGYAEGAVVLLVPDRLAGRRQVLDLV